MVLVPDISYEWSPRLNVFTFLQSPLIPDFNESIIDGTKMHTFLSHPFATLIAAFQGQLKIPLRGLKIAVEYGFTKFQHYKPLKFTLVMPRF